MPKTVLTKSSTQAPIYDKKKKKVQKVGKQGTYLNIIKATYNKPTINSIPNGEG